MKSERVFQRVLKGFPTSFQRVPDECCGFLFPFVSLTTFCLTFFPILLGKTSIFLALNKNFHPRRDYDRDREERKQNKIAKCSEPLSSAFVVDYFKCLSFKYLELPLDMLR